ncbi:hypothetical protein GN956_G8851 [Arapaima gigas]
MSSVKSEVPFGVTSDIPELFKALLDCPFTVPTVGDHAARDAARLMRFSSTPHVRSECRPRQCCFLIG